MKLITLKIFVIFCSFKVPSCCNCLHNLEANCCGCGYLCNNSNCEQISSIKLNFKLYAVIIPLVAKKSWDISDVLIINEIGFIISIRISMLLF